MYIRLQWCIFLLLKFGEPVWVEIRYNDVLYLYDKSNFTDKSKVYLLIVSRKA